MSDPDHKLVRTTIEEVAIHSVIPFTLYDKNRKVLVYKGIALTPTLIGFLSSNELYKLPEKERKADESDQKIESYSRISQKTANLLLDINHELQQAVQNGKRPSIQACYAVRDNVLREVAAHIETLKNIGELRINANDYNLSHGINVSILTTAIAMKLNYPKEELQELAVASFLHDIGKTKLPELILDKPSRLTAKEFEVIKLHSTIGYKIIKEDHNYSNNIALTVLDHHESYDGTGYTRQLAGEKIFKYAQIITMADAFDAASSDKVYASAKHPRQIIKEVLKESRKFNPKILYTLVHMVDYNTGNLKEPLTGDIA